MSDTMNGVDDRNTVNPYQPGYESPGPHPDDTYQPTRVTARAVTVDGTTVEQAHAAMDNALLQHKKFVDSVQADRDRYSDEGFREQLSMFNDTAAAKAVDTAVTQAEKHVESLATKVEKIRRDLSPNGDTAAELRATRYWNRTQALLDSSKDGATATAKAQDLIRTASRDELGTLLQELPAWLTAHGHTAEWLDAVIDQAVPEYGSAREDLKKGSQALTILKSNADSLRKSFTTPGYRSFLINYNSKYDPDK